MPKVRLFGLDREPDHYDSDDPSEVRIADDEGLDGEKGLVT